MPHDHRLLGEVCTEAVGFSPRITSTSLHNIGAPTWRRTHRPGGQQACALDVAQELDAKTRSVVRRLSIRRECPRHEADLVSLCRRPPQPQVGLERGEGIVGNLRARPLKCAQSGWTCPRSDIPRVTSASKLQLQAEDALFAGRPSSCSLRRLVRGGGEAGIAPSAPSAVRDDDLLIRAREVQTLGQSPHRRRSCLPGL